MNLHACACAALLALGSWTAPAPPPATHGAAAADSVTLRSQYVPMPDGVRLAVDLALPTGAAAGARVPALVMITRYGRSHAGQQPILAVRFFAERGYAVVRVDTRGSGASFGAWTGPLSRDERADARAIVPYAARSPAPLCSLRI